MVQFQSKKYINISNSNHYFDYNSMMTSHHSSKNLSSITYIKCNNSNKISNNFIHYFSNFFLFIFFFWAFFYSSLSPLIEIGSMWPPKNITPFNPYDIPLLNTIILVSSGATITWAHHSLMNNMKKEMIKSMLLTIILGITFSILQWYEYLGAPFTMADSIYRSTFFIATRFQGIHVLIGTTFIMINLFRVHLNHYSNFHHFGFEAAAWYWHFVDVIWLLLYISIYWWSTY